MSKQTRSNEQIHEYFDLQGCKLLDNYVNASVKMKYICKCGRESLISWNHFFSGKRCGYCHSTGRKKKYSLEEVKEIFKNKECSLLEKKYINNKLPLAYICKCGNESKISLDGLLRGQFCRICAGINRSGENNVNWKPDRIKKDHDDLVRKRCLNHIYKAIRKINTKHENKVIPLLGYSPKEMMNHFGNINFKIFGVDHIFPIQAFLDYGINDVRLINDLGNLRLIIKKENFIKGHKYNKEDFLKWLQKKGINGFQKLVSE